MPLLAFWGVIDRWFKRRPGRGEVETRDKGRGTREMGEGTTGNGQRPTGNGQRATEKR
jgi:hypothetical protein